MKFSLDTLVTEYESLEVSLTDEAVYSDQKRVREIVTRKKSLEKAVTLYREYLRIHSEYEGARIIVGTESDPDIVAMAREEIVTCEARIAKLEEDLTLALLPKDPSDDKNVIMEIRAGVGGEEASLFARELANAYVIFAREEGYSVEIIEESFSDTGGYREFVAKISGFGAYSRFKFEGGTHRVQRIPETENKWRVHTSTITVALLPEVEAVDVEIREEDLEILACRASGAGGQHVNKTNSAIRVVHKPSGLAVECQNERSQLQNKAKAIEVLRARLYAMEEEKRAKAIGETRLSQVGTGDRSEKIRTYNFPQDRVTDHRIGQNFSNIPAIMLGKLAPIIDAVAIADQTARLEAAAG